MSLIGKSIGNYHIKAKLGEGGMGAVYLGEHPLIGKRVAVKVLLEELASKEEIVSRFFNEAKAVNDIGHENIVDIVDFGKTKNDFGGDVVYFIMEFLDGESLAARLRRTGLSFVETMHVMAQCCSGLSASHAKGIVHRDLKPDNLYLCPRGTDKNFVKILDFGIAKLTGDGGTSHKTRTGLVIGTPAYMSPEQCEGKGLIDHRSDVYSLGTVMYELLTGRVPHPGEGFGEILVAHLTKIPDLPSTLNPDIKPEVEAIVMHAIEKDRNRRFQSMEEFGAAIANPTAHLASYSPLPGYTPSGSLSGGTMGSMMAIEAAEARKTGSGRGTAGPTTGVGPRPTTLSGAASALEGEGELAPKKNLTPVFAAVAGLLVLVGVGGFFAMKPKADTKAAEQPMVATPPPIVVPEKPKNELVKISISSDPPGAKVFRADTNTIEPGVTPLTLTVKRGDPGFDIQLKLDGFRPGARTLATEHDQAVMISLEKAPAVVPVADNPEKDKVASKHDRKHGSSEKSDKPVKSGKEKKEEGGGDDMKLLQPKF